MYLGPSSAGMYEKGGDNDDNNDDGDDNVEQWWGDDDDDDDNNNVCVIKWCRDNDEMMVMIMLSNVDGDDYNVE